jgi:hypothetical protein
LSCIERQSWGQEKSLTTRSPKWLSIQDHRAFAYRPSITGFANIKRIFASLSWLIHFGKWETRGKESESVGKSWGQLMRRYKCSWAYFETHERLQSIIMVGSDDQKSKESFPNGFFC